MPLDDDKRLQAVRRYGILGAPSDPAFDRIIGLAAEFFQVPIAVMSVVDHDRTWFVSRLGLDTPHVPREPGLCASAILSPDVYHIRDTAADPRSRDNPLVSGEPRLRFYAAAPLRTHDDCNLGTLCIMDRKPRDLADSEKSRLAELAALIVDELELRTTARKIARLEDEHQRLVQRLHEANAATEESEERFRDLFDEAPIAYVHEDLNSRFIRANRAALRILGIKPEEAIGTIGKNLVADTPDNQRRLKKAFDSIGRGTDTQGVVLEMRRKDNGKPVWIEWWSKPDPSGNFTRTMFFDITERVQMTRDKVRLEAQNLYLQEEILREHNFGEVVGNSRALRSVLRHVDQVAPTDSTVLVFGETGTGKELIARAIHEKSLRRENALVKVNCGAISAGLVESELFGHVKGAFTGAVANRDGRFKVADGGTIFLDEVGELPLETQVKLLRVLQEQEFEPIGSSRSIKVNVRVIAATNRDLAKAVADGRFREDLYYRLNVVPVRVPPLRERLEDLPLLVHFFLQRFATRFNQTAKGISEETMKRLKSYEWPGNIRELQNVLERAVILSPDATVTFGPEFGAEPTQGVILNETSANTAQRRPVQVSVDPGELPLEEVERRHIESVLERTNGLIEGERGAARVLGVNPSTLRSRMGRLGIRRKNRTDHGKS